MFRSNLLGFSALLIAIGFLVGGVAEAGETQGARYQRSRHGATSHYAPSGAPSGYGYGGYQPNFYYRSPVVSGSWYARPYPYHFDYYRNRFTPPAPPAVDRSAECPCALGPVAN